MNDFILSCCSTTDLTKEHLEKRGLEYVCFHYMLDGVTYTDDLGQSMSSDEFYSRLRGGADCSTSQVNISEYLDFFTKYLEQGKDILHVSISSGISGSINSARNAASIAVERFPDRKIYVVDSLAASSGYGLLMDKLADLRDD
ncbi:MAG: DegV family protein, partial [Monoglobales bacterium]